MRKTRKVVMRNDAGRILTEEQETPAPKPGQLLIEVHASMVSPGTELGGIKRRRENPGSETQKHSFGYTNAGVVIGKEGDCDEFEIGDRVAGMGGGYALHATYACVPHNLCAKIPENVKAEEAACIHLAATALHAVQRGRIRIGENVVIAGLGVLGQFASQVAKTAGAYVIGLDQLPLRIGIAENAGIDLAVIDLALKGEASTKNCRSICVINKGRFLAKDGHLLLQGLLSQPHTEVSICF